MEWMKLTLIWHPFKPPTSQSNLPTTTTNVYILSFQVEISNEARRGCTCAGQHFAGGFIGFKGSSNSLRAPLRRERSCLLHGLWIPLPMWDWILSVAASVFFLLLLGGSLLDDFEFSVNYSHLWTLGNCNFLLFMFFYTNIQYLRHEATECVRTKEGVFFFL